MEMERGELKIRDVLDLYRNGMLKANSEYQRGAVWSRTRQKKLIDSVFRGYPIPLIYLHHIKKTVAEMKREDLEIIDGQQRINALFEFAEGAYRLLDPIQDDAEAKFPIFIKQQPCAWGRKEFETLPADLRESFLETPLAIVRVTTDNENEVRDLFVRLQAGLPLNSQETRDAWPGQFTDFVLRIGGKPQVARYPGHPFFQRIMGMKPEADRGKTRQLAAQISILFLHRRAHGNEAFIDINSRSIDDFYYAHLDFNRESPDAQRFVSILDKLTTLLGSGKRPRLKGHDAIHLVLLVDALVDDYTRAWEDALASALDQFLHDLALRKRTKDELNPDEFWTQYGQWTRVNSDRGDRIAHRHAFYAEKMLEYMGPLQLKDPKRSYGALERELIYYRDKKRCAVCGGGVTWTEAQIHHVNGHAEGGPTTIENGVLVHSDCHPRGQAAIDFAERWGARGLST